MSFAAPIVMAGKRLMEWNDDAPAIPDKRTPFQKEVDTYFDDARTRAKTYEPTAADAIGIATAGYYGGLGKAASYAAGRVFDKAFPYVRSSYKAGRYRNYARRPRRRSYRRGPRSYRRGPRWNGRFNRSRRRSRRRRLGRGRGRHLRRGRRFRYANNRRWTRWTPRRRRRYEIDLMSDLMD